MSDYEAMIAMFQRMGFEESAATSVLDIRSKQYGVSVPTTFRDEPCKSIVICDFLEAAVFVFNEDGSGLDIAMQHFSPMDRLYRGKSRPAEAV